MMSVRCRGVVPGLVVAIWVAFAVAAAQAQTTDPQYRIADIDVEATAGDAVQARAAALADGQRIGLRRLLERLTAGSGAGLPALGGVPVEDFVLSFEVLSERVGPTSYAATLAVTYDREAVERLLDTAGVAYVREPAPPTTLVPLWETGLDFRLWGADNDWKLAWDQAVDADAVAAFVVPLGDLQDLSLLNPEQAARGDLPALLALAERYRTSQVVVARLIGNGAVGTPLVVEAQRFGGGDDDLYQAPVTRAPGEPLRASLARAVTEMQAAFDTRFRERAIPPGPPANLMIVAPVANLEEWGALLRYLDGLAEVETATVRDFSRVEATLDLRVIGGVERFQETIGRAGWFLDGDQVGGWRLLRGGARGGASSF